MVEPMLDSTCDVLADANRRQLLVGLMDHNPSIRSAVDRRFQGTCRRRRGLPQQSHASFPGDRRRRHGTVPSAPRSCSQTGGVWLRRMGRKCPRRGKRTAFRRHSTVTRSVDRSAGRNPQAVLMKTYLSTLPEAICRLWRETAMNRSYSRCCDDSPLVWRSRHRIPSARRSTSTDESRIGPASEHW